MSGNPSTCILVLEDDPDILSLLESILQADGFTVEPTATIDAFRRTLERSDVSICIIDLGLPDGNGISLLRELRDREATGVIVLTGRGGEVDKVLGLEMGADDYITKPFRPRELLARVHALSRRLAQMQKVTSVQADTSIPFGPYELNVTARCVYGPGGGEVDLTTAEFDVLHVLLKRRGAVLSRDEIMNAAKGRDWNSYDRAIDGLISRLRRKLPAEPGKTYIRTIHGVGYAFSA